MDNLIELAEAQLTGYSHAQRGFSIESLIESMGITKKEWLIIKDRSHNILSDNDVKYIDNYFRQKR